MKKIFILILVAYGFQTFAQNPSVAISFFNMNKAFLGVDNPITIVVEKTSCKKIFVTTSNGKIEKAIEENNCGYIFRPENNDTPTFISVFKIDKIDTIKLGEFPVRVVDFPLPTAIIGNQHFGNISCAEIKAQSGISAALVNSYICCSSKITQFTFQIIREKKSIFLEEATGNLFTKTIQEYIQLIRSGDKIIITGIKAKGCDKIERNLEAIELRINC